MFYPNRILFQRYAIRLSQTKENTVSLQFKSVYLLTVGKHCSSYVRKARKKDT